jgi:hypothetical protein
MPIAGQHIFQKVQKPNQLSPITLTPLMHPAEQTRLSWARRIESYETVPVVFKPFFAPFLEKGRFFPNCVLTPTFEGFLFRATEKLIVDLEAEIYILTRSGQSFETLCYPLAGISYVELKTTLLDSRITISGISSQGSLVTTTFRFNSVTDYLFTPLLEKIRSVAVDGGGPALPVEMDKFDQWSSLNFKFMNYARRSLLGGEKVIQAFLQPEIQRVRFSIFGKTFYQMISATHATLLTDRELILIREEHLRSGGGKYGGAWDYIPLEKISSLSIVEQESGLLLLSIHLPAAGKLACLFQPTARPELEQLLANFKALTNQAE